MSKHVLFFLHGMGQHDASWHQDGLDVLRSAFQEYDHLRSLNFEDVFDPHPVVYDDLLQEIRNRAKEDFGQFKSSLLDSLAESEASIKSSLERQLDRYQELAGVNDGFIWTHLLDVILYRFSNTVRMAIDTSVAEQILKTIKRAHTSWSVLAHSLGTSVAHNTINSLYNTGLVDANGNRVDPISPEETRCTTLMMISNVSRVLQRADAKVYETKVKPGSPSSGRLCSFYLNARHKLDLVTKPKPFNPDLWPDEVTFSTERYQHIRPSHIAFEKHEIERVHAFDHYLMNPRVHVPLFRSILGRFIVGPEEFRAAKARFDSDSKSQSIDRAREILESRLPAATGNWRNLLAGIKRMYS